MSCWTEWKRFEHGRRMKIFFATTLQHGSLSLCSLLSANSQIGDLIGQKRQLTGCDYGNDMRNAMRVKRSVLTWVTLLFIPCDHAIAYFPYVYNVYHTSCHWSFKWKSPSLNSHLRRLLESLSFTFLGTSKGSAQLSWQYHPTHLLHVLFLLIKCYMTS